MPLVPRAPQWYRRGPSCPQAGSWHAENSIYIFMFINIYILNCMWFCSPPCCLLYPCVKLPLSLTWTRHVLAQKLSRCTLFHVSLLLQTHTDTPWGGCMWELALLCPVLQLMQALFSANLSLFLVPRCEGQLLSHL